jgi:hypothetical protein
MRPPLLLRSSPLRPRPRTVARSQPMARRKASTGRRGSPRSQGSPRRRRRESLKRDLSSRERMSSQALLPQKVRLLPTKFLSPHLLRLKMRRRRRRQRSYSGRPSLLPPRRPQALRRQRLLPPKSSSHLNPWHRPSRSRLMLPRYRLKSRVCPFKHQSKCQSQFKLLPRSLKFRLQLRLEFQIFLSAFLQLLVVSHLEISSLQNNNRSFTSRCSINSSCTLKCSSS